VLFRDSTELVPVRHKVNCVCTSREDHRATSPGFEEHIDNRSQLTKTALGDMVSAVLPGVLLHNNRSDCSVAPAGVLEFLLTSQHILRDDSLHLRILLIHALLEYLFACHHRLPDCRAAR
jgi:hypothetical protein